MKITECRNLKKFRRKAWPKGIYCEIYTFRNALHTMEFELYSEDKLVNRNFSLPADDVFADDWEEQK